MITLKHATFAGIAIAIAGWVFSALAWPALPAQVAVHFDIHGQPDGYGAKEMATLLMPGLILLFAGLFALLPRISPKGWELRGSESTVAVVAVVTELFLLLVHAELLRSARSGGGLSVGLVVFGTGALLALIGNRFGKLRRNFFIGIRTPWTLADPEVWLRTHRVGGRIFVALGLLVMLAALLPKALAFAVMLVATLAAAGITIAYSYVVYRRLHPTVRT